MKFSILRYTHHSTPYTLGNSIILFLSSSENSQIQHFLKTISNSFYFIYYIDFYHLESKSQNRVFQTWLFALYGLSNFYHISFDRTIYIKTMGICYRLQIHCYYSLLFSNLNSLQFTQFNYYLFHHHLLMKLRYLFHCITHKLTNLENFIMIHICLSSIPNTSLDSTISSRINKYLHAMSQTLL